MANEIKELAEGFYCHETAILFPNVKVNPPAFIGPYCIIGSYGFQHPEWLAGRFVSEQIPYTEIGNGARLLGHSIISCGTLIGAGLRSDYHCIVGEDCIIGDQCVIEYGARIYDRVRIGNGTTISGFVCNDAVIGHNCVVQGKLVHSRSKPGREPAPIIEDDCFVGMDALVIGDVIVHKGSVIAAGAVVTKDTEEGYLYIGAPARKIRKKQWF